MPFIEVNGANIYYQIYGDEHPDRPPVLLIHGSTITGQVDWGLVAPLLARSFRVIVPDCRGHGQSTNPNNSYSFRELAADMAALVGALGYSRAHIIGHSNGGNVALVTLLEHPEVVQTAVIQAANAYVSQDLIDKEPGIFDPERVQRLAPEWMQQMISLHGPTHGEGYWRDLLAMTVKEIISQPNYTPSDLAQVKRPTLVIQGENDRVNAPARHAQFIARHILDSELWLPRDTGHNVHLERLFAWVQRVLDFLERRGDDANDALYRLRRHRFSDARQTIFDVRAAHSKLGESPSASLQVSGRVLVQEQVDSLREYLQQSLAAAKKSITPEISVLLNEATPWALVNRSVTDVRREPGILAERITQALLGESLRLLEQAGEWAFVRLERDGYLGWVQMEALQPASAEEVHEQQRLCDYLVVAELAHAVANPDGNGPANHVGKIPFGVPVPVVDQRGEYTAIRLPDGHTWWLPAENLLPLAQRPKPDRLGIDYALTLIRRFIGVPYLWGGRSSFGFDCSGLAQTFLAFLGVQARRDADQQHQAALPVSGNPQPGDLLFFGSQDEDARRPITHVAISLGGNAIIHANGSAWGVSYNSLDPDSPIYRPWLRENLVGVGRFW